MNRKKAEHISREPCALHTMSLRWQAQSQGVMSSAVYDIVSNPADQRIVMHDMHNRLVQMSKRRRVQSRL